MTDLGVLSLGCTKMISSSDQLFGRVVVLYLLAGDTWLSWPILFGLDHTDVGPAAEGSCRRSAFRNK